MENKNKILIGTGIGLTALLIVGSSGGGTAKKGALMGKQVDIAKSLLSKWNKYKETDSVMKAFIKQLWKGLGYSDSKADAYVKDRTAWSAAFISFCMKTAGHDDFPISAAHACFAEKIKTGKYPNYTLHRIGNYAPKVGDIVLLNRGGGTVTFDNVKCGLATHSDIVTEVAESTIKTIGGNLSDTVSERTVKTKNGRIDNSLYFAVIEVKK
jgi:hypothetical protein